LLERAVVLHADPVEVRGTGHVSCRRERVPGRLCRFLHLPGDHDDTVVAAVRGAERVEEPHGPLAVAHVVRTAERRPDAAEGGRAVAFREAADELEQLVT
jgi:hypothetical protein